MNFISFLNKILILQKNLVFFNKKYIKKLKKISLKFEQF